MRATARGSTDGEVAERAGGAAGSAVGAAVGVVLPKLVCPSCRSPLRADPRGATCRIEGDLFPVKEGVLRLVARLEGDDPREDEERLSTAWGGGRPPRTLAEARALPKPSGGTGSGLAWKARAAAAEALIAEWYSNSVSVLDLGAGCGWFSRLLLRHGHRPVAIDLQVSPPTGVGTLPALGHSFSEIPAIKADMEELPFAPASFDRAVTFGSFSYLREPLLWLERLHEVLVPGGEFAAAMIPLHRGSRAAKKASEARTARVRRMDGGMSYRHFDREEIEALSSQAGFRHRWVVPDYPALFRLSRAAKSAVLRDGAAQFPLLIARRLP